MVHKNDKNLEFSVFDNQLILDLFRNVSKTK